MGATNPFVDQDSFRWKLDVVGLNVDSDWAEAINTQLGTVTTIAYDVNFRLRFLLQNTGDKDESDGYNLQYQIDSGGWVNVTGSSNYVRAFTTSQYTDGDATSQILGGGTHDEGDGDTDGTIASFTFALGEESENEFCFQFRSADFSGSEVLELRMSFDNGADLDAYTNTISMTMPTPPASNLVQANFRIRNGDTVGINVNSDWVNGLNANATINCHHRFRIRFEIEETASIAFSGTLKLQCQRNAEGWNDYAAYPEDPADATETPLVWITGGNQYVDGVATTDILSGSAKTFTAGEGQEDNLTGTIALNNQHTELEFIVIIPTLWSTASGASAEYGQNVDADTFQFRIVEGDGTVLDTYTNIPTVTLNVPDYYIGGTYCETAGFLGPFADSNGNLYWLQEVSETHANLTMLKSIDQGKTWSMMDNAGSPSSVSPYRKDNEACDIQLVGQTLHIMHNSAGDVDYHQFHMSDHATLADEWDGTVLNESVVTGLTGLEDMVAMSICPSGTVYAFYSDDNSGVDGLYYKRRSGTWGSQQTVDAEAGVYFGGVQAVLGQDDANDYTYIFYCDNTTGIIYWRRIDESGTLSGRTSFATGIGTTQSDRGPFTPALYYDDGGVEVIFIVYRKSDTKAYSNTLRDNSKQTEKAASDNTVLSNPISGPNTRQVTAFIANDGTTVYLRYSDLTTRDIFEDENANEGGWGTDTEEIDAIKCNFIRGHVVTHTGKVLAYIYEDSEDMGTVNEDGGFTGGSKYGEISLDVGADVTFAGTAALLTTTPGTGMLAVARAFAGTAALLTTTPDIVSLLKDIPFTGTAALLTTTPDTVTLEISKFFAGTAALLTTTPDGVMLSKDVPFTGAALLSAITPDIAVLAVDRTFAGAALLATVTPNVVMLSKDIPFTGAALLATATPDVVVLEIAKFFSGTAAMLTTTPLALLAVERTFGGAALLATTTPSAALIADLAFGGTALLATTTPDTVELTVAVVVSFAGTSALITTTPSAILDMARGFAGSAALLTTTPDSMLAVDRSFAGASLLAIVTPDTAMLSKDIPFTGTALLATTTPDAVIGLSKLFAGSALMAITTPDVPMLAVDRAFGGTALLAIVTPDTVELLISGTIDFAGTAALATVTPSALLSVARSFVGTSAMVTTTPSGLLSVDRSFGGQAQLATVTPSAALALGVAFGGTARAQFTTTDLAVLGLVLQFAGAAHLQMMTPDDAELFLRVAAGLVRLIVSARRPGSTVSARRPGVDVTGRS